MAIAKVIEVIAESPDGWEAAAQNALVEAARTVDDIKEIWVGGMKAVVEGGTITNYRLTARITFLVKRD